MKIRMVGAHWKEAELSGVFLDITFSNEQTVLLPLTEKAHDPAFTGLLEDDRICSPKTDGEQVYWTGGPSLSCAEILQMVRGNSG